MPIIHTKLTRWHLAMLYHGAKAPIIMLLVCVNWYWIDSDCYVGLLYQHFFFVPYGLLWRR